MEIPLSGKHGKGKVVIVSPCDYAILKPFKWWVKFSGVNRQQAYIKTSFRVNGKQRYISIHRMIMNPKIDQEVDHINGNGLDNRRENLRVCTTAENVRNSSKRKDSTHQYKGTVFVKNRNRWRSRIQVNGKRYWSGYFKTEIEAAKRFDEMAKKYHGEYVKLNL
jgi:hypothetical protein